MERRNECILCFFSSTPLAVTPLPCRPQHTSDKQLSIFSDTKLLLGEALHHFLLQGSITMRGTKILCTQIKCNKRHHE
ncbi:hypothetical protein GLYMA_02G081700v4 [Glycine max]|uniref:Uncharacterized protein n=2 Tax=Glycine subgen. Soja TaxID=1462606 RepID=K7K725_SOYBN|nr:hypothetical protein JHK87_003364 [Glycine soja]KAG5062492.1 hypothetical protein JHK85_003675 [Glycine max]KAG5079439.1 hypothetical protein JHK86_003504 [Glycine max]KAH1059301.1 hypothetical protein GYH30_003379 [Glycine max]KRH70298.1 hypothetical protein GLYMA_02G081700v4 [Glycine max]